jgi:hypothetical protein
MAVPSWKTLVHYPDGWSNVRVVFETPERDALLVVPEGDRWVVKAVRLSEGERDGHAYTTEVQVEPAPED